uniref:Uncharacterized protein n=1 Tax=Timema poppense TaxID=170557 RepID=A0A7R9CVG9_TIMPO|nr:unnamed protein product [Timema poppensis]
MHSTLVSLPRSVTPLGLPPLVAIWLSDQVRCFHCDGGLSSWDPTDDPFVEHARWFPHCGYITLVRGTQFVKDMLVEHPPVLASSNIGLNRTETNEANQNQVGVIGESSQSLAELVDTVLDIQSNSSQQDTSKVESKNMSQSMPTLHEKNSLATSQDEDEYHSISAVSTRSLELLPAQITYSSQVHKVSTYSGTLLPEVMSTNNPPVILPGTSTCALKNGLDLDAPPPIIPVLLYLSFQCVTLDLEILLEPSAVFEVFSLIYLMVEKHLPLCFLLFFERFPDLSLLFPLSFVGISSIS